MSETKTPRDLALEKVGIFRSMLENAIRRAERPKIQKHKIMGLPQDRRPILIPIIALEGKGLGDGCALLEEKSWNEYANEVWESMVDNYGWDEIAKVEHLIRRQFPNLRYTIIATTPQQQLAALRSSALLVQTQPAADSGTDADILRSLQISPD